MLSKVSSLFRNWKRDTKYKIDMFDQFTTFMQRHGKGSKRIMLHVKLSTYAAFQLAPLQASDVWTTNPKRRQKDERPAKLIPQGNLFNRLLS